MDENPLVMALMILVVVALFVFLGVPLIQRDLKTVADFWGGR